MDTFIDLLSLLTPPCEEPTTSNSSSTHSSTDEEYVLKDTDRQQGYTFGGYCVIS